MGQVNYDFKREFKNVYSGYKAMNPHTMAGWPKGMHTCSQLSRLGFNCFAFLCDLLSFRTVFHEELGAMLSSK